MNQMFETRPGWSYPLGASVLENGVNFSLYSKNATSVQLLLFDQKDHSAPLHILTLDPKVNKTFNYWHIFVEGLNHGQLYAYRIDGPFEPSKGFRFNKNKVLLDPYTRAVATDSYDRKAALGPEDNCASAMKSVVVDNSLYDWEGDRPLNRPFSKTVIYELHVGGFTKHPNSGLPKKLRGTYRGLIEKIPYLKSLGINAVELMPVHQFDPYDVLNENLCNYWGYSPIAFFAPHAGYSSQNDPIKVLDEFRDMVKALHREGIGVIMDVVFNHTAEGNHQGPTLCFKGIENRAYYILENEKQYYQNLTGTGNTIRANHSVVRRLIRDCLQYWVAEMHLDGFRFDLATILARNEDGDPIKNPPILWSIDTGPVLASAKIIAEAWDLRLYQLGSFTGDRWAEWNGKFRDDVRRFIRGDNGVARLFARRIAASGDVFKDIIQDPNQSVNFVTCHDGFTMNDLVSYNFKYNHDNGENNRDGHNQNFSWNCGEEGPSKDEEVEALRKKQIKNFFTILMISQGTPMFLMGDEIRRTQLGNNNGYCQDNPLSWMDWTLVEKNKELLDFVRKLIGFNLSVEFFQEEHYWLAPEPISSTDISFHGVHLDQPDFSDHSHSIAFTLNNSNFGKSLHVMVNSYWQELRFQLPTPGPSGWLKIIDTAQDHPNDFQSVETANVLAEPNCKVQKRSVVLVMTIHDEGKDNLG